jgi:hypothetical protein
MSEMHVIVVILFALSVILLLIALGHLLAMHRHWRARRHVHALHRAAWTAVFLLAAAITAGLGLAIRSYHLLSAETPIATLTAQQLGPQDFAVRIELPDGTREGAELHGDEWQLDAHVIKWTPRAVALGAQPLYRLDRLASRYRDATQAQTTPPSVVPLNEDSIIDLWQLKQQFPRWLPWIDADYGSAAYLPLVDGGKYTATLSAAGGLIARPADKETADKLQAGGW